MPVGSLDGAGLLGHLDARFRRPLMSFFLRRIGDRAEAEDLTQEVFVRLIGAMERDQIPLSRVDALAPCDRPFGEHRRLGVDA